MKRIGITVILLLLIGYGAMAQVRLPTNADFMRTLNRNATNNSIDAALFNPAGIISLDDGTYLHVGNQFAITGIALPGAANPHTNFSGFMPDVSLVWKQAGYGFYATLNSPMFLFDQIKLSDGSPEPYVYKKQDIELDMGLGAVFAMGDFFSASFGLRLLYANMIDDYSFYTGTGTSWDQLLVKSQGLAVGGTAGVMFNWHWLGIAVNYRSETPLLANNKITRPSITIPPTIPVKEQDFQVIPGDFRVGASFNIVDKVFLQTSYDLVFNKQRIYLMNDTDGSSLFDAFEGNTTYTQRFGIGLEHKATDLFTWGIGTRYTMGNREDGFTIGLGGVFNVKNRVDIKPSILVPLIFDDFKNNKMNLYVNIGATFYFSKYKG